MPYNGETDIIGKVLDSLTWLDHIVLLNWKKPFSEGGIGRDLIRYTKDAEWIINLDSDEVYTQPIDFYDIPPEYDIATVNIRYCFLHNDDHYYRSHKNSLRAFRNKPELFNFDGLPNFHHGRIPYRSDKIYKTGIDVKHYQFRTAEQAKAKYKFYTENDNTQKYDYMLDVIRALETMDYSKFEFTKMGEQWLSQ